MKAIKILAIAIGVYIVLGIIVDSAIGYFQPQSGATIVLRTWSASESQSFKDTVLAIRNDDGQLWVESGHWFRGWYYRALENPSVAIVSGEDLSRYTAVPVNTPEAVELMTKLMGKGEGARYWVGRVMLLFAPIKPLRLDPLIISVK
jgi:hypothetical protein